MGASQQIILLGRHADRIARFTRTSPSPAAPRPFVRTSRSSCLNILGGRAVATAALFIAACTAKSTSVPPLTIQRQGSFAVGGRVITMPGTFDPIRQGAYNPAGPDSAGQRSHAVHRLDVDQHPGRRGKTGVAMTAGADGERFVIPARPGNGLPHILVVRAHAIASGRTPAQRALFGHAAMA